MTPMFFGALIGALLLGLLYVAISKDGLRGGSVFLMILLVTLAAAVYDLLVVGYHLLAFLFA